MEDQESKMKTDSKSILEEQDQGTGMGAIWDIQRFQRLLDRAKARRLVGESASKT
jgi:hypothetical protein